MKDLRISISEAVGLELIEVVRIISRAPYTYKLYKIPKRTGGYRDIAQPAKETKLLQRWLMENVFNHLPIHDSASAYKVGSSIKMNASSHAKNRYLSKFDFKDFFGSIKLDDLRQHLKKYLGAVGMTQQDVEDAVRLSCIAYSPGAIPRLSVGAPSSPVLSNSILYQFDSELTSWSTEQGITYTRYADDLAFSTNENGLTRTIEPFLRRTISELSYPRLKLNAGKTTHVSMKHCRRVTGLIINNEGNVSLGRDRKRSISAMVHKFILRQLAPEELRRLQGLLAFSLDVEPEFIGRLKKKYSPEVIGGLLTLK